MSVSRFSKFFDLPREVRDIIYQFTLQHEGPLLYLPASAQKGRRAGFYTSADTPNEHNQIKYGNKLLWQETAGLEIKHNDLLFCAQQEANTEYWRVRAFCADFLSTTSRFSIGLSRRWSLRSQTEGLTLLLNFLQNSHKKWIFRLRKIYVRSPEGAGCVDNGDFLEFNEDTKDGALSGIFQFCRYHPQMTILEIVSNWIGSQIGVRPFLYDAYWLLNWSRKGIPAELKFIAKHMVLQDLPLNQGEDLDHEVPKNWKFIPDGVFNEWDLRNKIREENKNSADPLAPDFPEDQLVQLVESWYKNGLE